ncbi:hypothetical protein MMC30_008314 [Trapelia coarctata]|nr:hypothetical protein [Trapelia coarctata]
MAGQTDLLFSRSMERAAATSRTGRRPSLLTSALQQSEKSPSPSPPTVHRPTIAQRRSPHPTLGKLVVGESPSAETALHANQVQLNQPDGAPPPSSPHRPSHSQPIAIPIRRRHENSRPTTPLTAREERGAYFPESFDTIPPRPQISHSLRPGYKRPDEREPNLNLATYQKNYLSTKALEQLKELSAFADASQSMPSPNYTPTSPLSPPKPHSALSAGLQAQSGTRRGKDLHLQPLPRYHPAHYQPPTPPKSTNITPRSPVVNRTPYTPQYHQRQATDVRQKLKQYQHEIIKTARVGPLPITPGGSDTPKAPQLQPRESPGSPATPMMLDKQLDYMTAGLRDTQLSDGSPVSSREVVDKIIRQENERRMGFHSNSSSPAVSPAA